MSKSKLNLSRIYNNHGVKVKISANNTNRLPTVQKLVEQITKKHQEIYEGRIREKDISMKQGISDIDKKKRIPLYWRVSNQNHKVALTPLKTDLNDSCGLASSREESAGPPTAYQSHRPHYVQLPEEETAEEKSRRHDLWLWAQGKKVNSLQLKDLITASLPRERRSIISQLIDLDSRFSSSTSPNGPFSSTDIISPNNLHDNRHTNSEDFRQYNDVDIEKERRRRDLRDSIAGNHRVKSNKSKTDRGGNSSTSDRSTPKEKEKDNRERDKDQRTLSIDRLSLAEEENLKNKPFSYKQNYFKPNGVRAVYPTKEIPLLPQRAQPPPGPSPQSSREPDDLVAMGTLWNPSSTSVRNGKQLSSINNSNQQSLPATTGVQMNGVRRYSTRMSVMQQSNVNGRIKDEPKYPDPLTGATPSFQQRLAELASLESDTIRWEKSRKLKKKLKQQDT